MAFYCKFKLLKERDDVLPIVENFTRLSYKTPTPCKRNYNRGFCPEIVRFDHEKALIAGKRRKKKAFLAVGIPTVLRLDALAYYISNTLLTLINELDESSLKEIVFIVLLADAPKSNRTYVLKDISSHHYARMASGLIQIIEIPKNFYPPLNNPTLRYGDKYFVNAKWRTKQAIDYSFLFLYSMDQAQYYIQLEDDISAAPQYLASIKDFIKKQTQPWISLAYSRMDIVGTLYKTSSLLRLAQFVMFFYDVQPVSKLYRFFNAIHFQRHSLPKLPSLFQHVGEKTSKLGFFQKLTVDRDFEIVKRKYKGDNPQAVIQTSMKTIDGYDAGMAYSIIPGYCWMKEVRIDDTYMIIFNQSHFLSRIALETATAEHSDDFLRGGVIEVSPENKDAAAKKKPLCSNYINLGETDYGRIDIQGVDKVAKFKIKCLRIRITEHQTSWLLIREIAVWTSK
ncbi:uncharacterized protein TRIADDRAFT_51821 [Trichoplax adhaerens]|uniref:Uncharacterized protein n=1 Tax=Trichoplax adhaerens TaxID=10228 RepID=B3RKZ4_TRIAD|nr:hypothetical protein TRIADDRAFT_51821 [Trichoplax adhaerens]EDV28671.1 hypothetical protein TRIADDRAFT_51821 [Trichoplax adhaerens]|eukprot:XP_002107873.1 hypothetical protein TRIADDRAFT_51821 [Trichoplax adhaerens]